MWAMCKDAIYQLTDTNPMQHNAMVKRMRRFRGHAVTHRTRHDLASGAPENHARNFATPRGWD